MTPHEKMLNTMLSGLDPQQRHVVSWTPKDGNLRVVAAAGSGKTTSVVVLAANLVANQVVDPSTLIVTTFSRKAADELRSRLAKLIPPNLLQQIRVGTFHSLGLAALRTLDANFWSMSRCVDAEGGTRATGVPSGWEIWNAICSYGTVPGTQAESLKLPEPSSYYRSKIDFWRSQGFGSFEEVNPQPVGMMYKDRELMSKAWSMYTEAKKALNVWDFNDALERWEEALTENQLPSGANIVLVDEAQDNNVTQLNIVRALAGSEGRICLFGDLRQTIHVWRGSYPDLFQRADTTLQAQTREISTNYRSEAPIVALSNAIAAGKSWNLGSAAQPVRCTEKAYQAIEVLPATQTFEEEADRVAERIANDVQAGESPGRYAILCRTNASRALFEAALTRRNVPISVIGGSSVFRTREAEAVMAYCVLTQFNAVGSLDKILNQPRRFIPHSFIGEVHKNLSTSSDIVGAVEAALSGSRLKPGSRRGVVELIRTLEDLRGTDWKNVPKKIERLLCSTLAREAENADEDRQSLYVMACRIAEQFSSPLEFVTFAQKCCDGTASLAEGAKPSSCVTLSTVHAAKGLEWDHVYVSANRTMFPHRKSGNRDEENRLFYVAVTRAAHKVTFCWNRTEGLTSFLPSPEELKKYAGATK